MERNQRTRLEALGLLLLVFGSGVALGVAVDRAVVAAPAEEVASTTAEQADRDDERERERRPPMYRRVGELTEEQEARIDSILREHRGAMKALQREFSEAYDPRFWAIVETTREGISEVLTPEQAVRYDSLVAEYDRRRRKDDDDSGRERSDRR